MCGIAGYWGAGDEAVLSKMTDSLAHRGPNDRGIFVSGQLGLGHRRLSILDVSLSGHQPMHSESANTTIVFNGEIYNYRSIREDLKNFGYSFKSDSDTEVILAAYEQYGADCFKHFNGMFAIVLFDKLKNCLVMARDRLGKKPLYWSVQKNTFIFGSELKSLLAHPNTEKKVSYSALTMYLAFDYVPTPWSILENIFKLEPGHYAIVTADKIVSKRKFWDITFNANQEAIELSRICNEKDILSALDSKIATSVQSRFVADVPLGIFLSGGLDSSTIAYYAQKNSVKKIKTFSIGFEDKSYDESVYAKQVAAFLGTDHYESRFTGQDALSVVPGIAKLLDEPLADYSFIPTLLLSQFTKKHVTVALGGDGADELFFGYGTLQAEQLLKIIPSSVLMPLLKVLRAVTPGSHSHFSLGFKLDRLIAGIKESPSHRHAAWVGTFNKEARAELFTEHGLSKFKNINEYQAIDQFNANYSGQPLYNVLIYQYLRTYLMDQVLVKVDRASMAASLEVRAPFLDYKLVDFVNSIDLNYKIRGFKTKYLLKRLMDDKLPHSIVHRIKHGFGAPLSKWLGGELKPLVTDMLSVTTLNKQGIFNGAVVEKILGDHFSGKKDNRKQIWSLLVWHLWQDEYLR